MNKNDELIVTAELGDEARRFLSTDLGKKLLTMAQEEVIAAQELLERVNPTDVEAIRALQSQAKFGRSFEQWLAEIISRGDNAIAVYKQENQS